MPYNDQLAQHVNHYLTDFLTDIEEKKMFGGLCFLYKGKMSVGIIKDELVVRVLASKMNLELEKHNVRPMDFTKKPMKEFVYVTIDDIKEIPYWINLGIEHAKTKLK